MADFNIIQTADANMRRILDMVENVAASRANILISGESGTGKELLARYIHAKSPRASKKFVALNCAAVPEGLLESELFGYEKGAFTGAEGRKLGKFELANESTFLLDEISEMPLLLQAKLLRVLQEGEVERLGSLGPLKVNVRIVATTNRDLTQMVREGRFREDLFYRLNVVPLHVPALRARPQDIELLSQLFLSLSCTKNGCATKTLGSEGLAKLKSWSWPGNVRELQNVIERSVLLAKNMQLQESDILIEGYKPPSQELQLQAGVTVSEAERYLIMRTLEATQQNRTRAAELLGISIRTLRNKLAEYRRQKEGQL